MTELTIATQTDVPMCPYCEEAAALVTGRLIYPHRKDLHEKRFWMCLTCEGVYVGCHPGTARPLGRLASAELRQAKMQAHYQFDSLWTTYGFSRTQAYGWLARKLKIPADQCHIGMFDVDTCHRVIDLCLEFIDEQRQRTNLQEVR